MPKLSEWDPYSKYVQGGLTDGQFASGRFTVLAAGPPRLANIGGASAFGAAVSSNNANQFALPIGLVQNWSLNWTRNLMRFFEIGSGRSYFISGHTVGQIALGRVLYHGPSLLRMVYAYYQDAIDPTIIQPVFANLGAVTTANPHDVRLPPGYENLFMNLQSDLFDQPIGLLVTIKDNDEITLGSNYFEAAYLPTYNVGTDAQGTIIQESTMAQFERMIPVAVKAHDLIRDTVSTLLS